MIPRMLELRLSRQKLELVRQLYQWPMPLPGELVYYVSVLVGLHYYLSTLYLNHFAQSFQRNIIKLTKVALNFPKCPFS